jgi:hypothetical protein
MAFDRLNPEHLATLKTEAETDPIEMGYSGTNSTIQLLNLFNNPINNVGGEVVGEMFTPKLMLDVIVPDDLTPGGQFTQGELEWIKMLFESSSSLGDDLDAFRTKFRGLFPGNAQTVANLDARVRRLSRAEVLFGEDTVISRDDWFAARDS